MKTFLFVLNFLILMCCAAPTLKAQVMLYDDCFDGDFGGVLTADNPDLLSFGTISPDDLVFEIEGCLFPGEVDYNDLFTFFVPEGYMLESIQFGYVTSGILTEVDFYLWFGNDCVPWDSPNLAVENLPLNGPEDPWGSNVIAAIGPLASGYYSIRMTTSGWPSGTRYEMFFTLSCDDNTPPAFTTAPGELNATLNCSNLAGIANALALAPAGTDNSGTVSVVLTGDQTAVAPGCPNAYTRTRTWVLEDGCGNQSLQSYTQTISVTDQTGPAFTTIAGALDVALNCNDAAGLAAALALAPSGADACGSANLVLIADNTTPDLACPNAYNRVRSWRLVDACGNQSLAVFHQSIQVQDNTAPVAVAKNGIVAIDKPEGYSLTPGDVLHLGATYDACGDVSVVINPPVLGCDLLGQIVPVQVQVTDACGNSTNVVAMIEVTEDTGIKAPWDHDNIGNTANGDASHSPCEGTYTVTSSGFSMTNSDVAHFVYVELCGDGEITARVINVNPANGWGGVMVRENLLPGSRKVALKTALNNTIRREIRATPNTAYQLQQSAVTPGPVWMRITRAGNMFTLYSSPNGVQWQFQGSANLNAGNCVLMGIYAESTNNNLAISAMFDEVSVSGGIMAMAGLPDTEPVIMEAQLPGKESQVPTVFPNPGAGSYQIDLSPYAGTELTIDVLAPTGQALFSRRVLAGYAPEPLSLTQYPSGMYLVRILPEGGTPHSLRVVKK